jgi:hypothetical protein
LTDFPEVWSPKFFSVQSTKPGLSQVTTVVYDGLPEGLLTALTYGVSLAEHPEWRNGSLELCISVRSPDVIWAHALGFLAESPRGSCPFAYGNTLNFGERISTESDMTAFVVFAPAVLDRGDYTGIDVSLPGHEGHDVISVQGLYPIHDVERQFIDEQGLQAFWQKNWDPYDVHRLPAV